MAEIDPIPDETAPSETAEVVEAVERPEERELLQAAEDEKEHAPMLDVHPAHHAANSWKEFFIHIATIVLGLLIAVGLEQTVEFIHHRYQVAETREALRIERRININHFAMETEEFYRFVPKLEMDLAIFQYLKAHPHAPKEQWPGTISGYHMMSRYTDAAWRTAQQNNVLALMPDREVQQDDQLYRQLTGLTENMAAKEEAFYETAKLGITSPDPSQMSPEQIDLEIQGYSNVLLLYGRGAIEQRVLSSHYPDFKPTTTYEDEQRALHIAGGTEDDIRVINEMTERLRRADEAVAHDAGQSDAP
jgi:hypothetical protein